MNTIGGYFVENLANCKCKKDSMIIGNKYRIRILTERLERL